MADIGERFKPPGFCLPLLTPPSDEGLNRHRGALASVDLHKLANSGFRSVQFVASQGVITRLGSYSAAWRAS